MTRRACGGGVPSANRRQGTSTLVWRTTGRCVDGWWRHAPFLWLVTSRDLTVANVSDALGCFFVGVGVPVSSPNPKPKSMRAPYREGPT
jgi:hypothetical protein